MSTLGLSPIGVVLLCLCLEEYWVLSKLSVGTNEDRVVANKERLAFDRALLG